MYGGGGLGCALKGSLVPLLVQTAAGEDFAEKGHWKAAMRAERYVGISLAMVREGCDDAREWCCGCCRLGNKRVSKVNAREALPRAPTG